jgi:hypothetical protein
MGRVETLNRGVRPYFAAAARTCSICDFTLASGSPHIMNTSQCFAPTSSAASDIPPKYTGKGR